MSIKNRIKLLFAFRYVFLFLIALFIIPPTALATSIFSPISISDVSNENIQNLYKDIPIGNIEFQSIPFSIPNSEKNFLITSSYQAPTNPIDVTFQTSIDNPQRIHFLINSGNTYLDYKDKTLGKIKINFNDSSSFESNLNIGQNIREWFHIFPDLVSTVTDINSKEIWRSNTPGNEGPAVIDLYSLNIPENFRSKKLTSIEIHDLSQGILGPIDPAILLFAITVESDSFTSQNNSSILFIPGMFGSWNHGALLHGFDVPQSAWKKAGFVTDYDGLIQTIENSGYSSDPQNPNQSLFLFYYDWRKPVDTLATQLKSYIESTVLTKRPNTKIKIIGHSLGGLVGRAYTQKYGSSHVDQLITVGTPHKGAVDAYYLAEGGDIGPNADIPTRVALGLYLKANHWLFETPQKVIERTIPSFKDILPIFNFLTDDKTGVIKPVSQMVIKNTWLGSIDTTVSTLFPLLNAIGGKSVNTKEWIKIKKTSVIDQLLGKWKDGKPSGFTTSSNGDDTVLTKSSIFPADINSQLNLSHRDLVRKQEGISNILDIASISASTISTSTAPSLPVLIFSILSPAYIRVTGPGIIKESDELVVIPAASGGQYTVEVIGTNTGSYRLITGALTNNDVWNEFQGNTKNGEVDTFIFSFNASTGILTLNGNADALSYLQAARTKLSSLNTDNKSFKVSLGFLDSSIVDYNKKDYKKIPPKLTPVVAEIFVYRAKYKSNSEIIVKTNEILSDLAWAQEYIGRNIDKNPTVNLNDLTAKKKILSQLETKLESDKGKAKEYQALRLDYMRMLLEETEQSIKNNFLNRVNQQLFQLNFYISEANGQ